jgi:hypothetical protein
MARSALLLAGAGGLGALALSFVKVASRAEETRAKFNTVFRDLADSTRQWAEDFGDSVGRATMDVEAWLATLQDTFVPLGIARAEAASLSQELVKLGVDLASFNNEADAEVIHNLTSALVGNHETVRRYGVLISESSIKQEALNQGLNKSYAQLTDLEKVWMRYHIMLRSTTDAQGDAIRTGDSLANQYKRLSAEWTELRANVGALITSPLADVISDINWLLSTGLPQLAARYDRAQQGSRGLLPELELGRDTGVAEKFEPPWVKGKAGAGTKKWDRNAAIADLQGKLAARRQEDLAQVEHYNNHKLRLHYRYINRSMDALDELREAEQRAAAEAQARWDSVAHSMEYSMTRAFDRLIWEGESWRDAMTSILRDVARELMRVMVMQPLTQNLLAAFGHRPTPAPAPIPTVPAYESKGLAAGDVFSNPTVGLFGEAGPEAVLPLTRGPGGRLGIASHGGGASVNNIVQVINNTTQPVSARIGQSQQSGRDLMTQVFIEEWERGGPVRQTVEST